MNTPGGSGNGNNPSTSNGTSAVPFEQQQRERMASMRAAQQQQQQQQQVQQQQVQQVQQTNLESSFGPAPLRNDLIEKAIGFLTHPKVQDTPLSRKRDFLREKKGMTNAEIEEAIRRSGVTDVRFRLLVDGSCFWRSFVLTSFVLFCVLAGPDAANADATIPAATVYTSAARTRGLWMGHNLCWCCCGSIAECCSILCLQ